MFTRKRFIPPNYVKDNPEQSYRNLTKAVTDYLQSLEAPGSISIEEPGIWTPVLTFATVGDFAATYSTQTGIYTKIGRLVQANFALITSAFTHTTSVGAATITGLPFTSGTAIAEYVGKLEWSGVTKANYTELHVRVDSSASVIRLLASGSGQAEANVNAADMPTGGAVILIGSVSYVI